MKIGDAAAHFIEAGRAFGRAETLTEVHARLDGAIGRGAVAVNVAELRTALLEEARTATRLASGAQITSEQLRAKLEHPGTALAERVLRAINAARSAWRG